MALHIIIEVEQIKYHTIGIEYENYKNFDLLNNNFIKIIN